MCDVILFRRHESQKHALSNQSAPHDPTRRRIFANRRHIT